MGTGLPRQVMVKHKYVQSIIFNIPAGGLGQFAWRANGMFDPYVAGGAGEHQPMYFDQYAALYEHYCVIGSKITFKVSYGTNSAPAPYRMSAFVDSNQTLLATNIDAVAEATTGRKITLVPSNQTHQVVKSLKFSAKKTFGKAVLGNKALTGSGTTDPTEQQIFVLCTQAVGSVDVELAIVAEVEYIAIWTELKEVAQS